MIRRPQYTVEPQYLEGYLGSRSRWTSVDSPQLAAMRLIGEKAFAIIYKRLCFFQFHA
jgi:hypothetical protein